MISLKRLFYADFVKILNNKPMRLTLILPQILAIVLILLTKDNTINFQKTGYDLWVIYSKDVLLILTFIFPLLAIIYPYIIFDNEYRYNGPRTHSTLPLKMGEYFLSKLFVMWIFLAFIIITSSLMLLFGGYVIGAYYHIPEFNLYNPTFIIIYTFTLLPVCICLSAIHTILNIFFHNILINTVPFLLLIFISIFLIEWEYKYFFIHTYPFIAYSNLQHEFDLLFILPLLISISITILTLGFVYYILPKIQQLWVR